MTDESQVQKLVRRATEGSSDSFGKLYDLYSQQLFNFILSKVRHKPTAEDILHTVFLKAWNNLPKYKQQSTAKFSTWLFQVANYTIIDHWRTKKDISSIDGLDNLAQFANNPKLYESYDYLWRAMDELPEDYRTILYLRFIQEMPVEEAAEAMQKSQVGARVLQYRALKALRKNLTKHGYEIF